MDNDGDVILNAAYAAGFEASGEGWNAEYPFADHNRDFEKDADWIAKRDQRLRPILAALRIRTARNQPHHPDPKSEQN